MHERVEEEMRGETDAKVVEMEDKIRGEMYVKFTTLDVKQQQIDAKYETMEKMYVTFQNLMGN